MEYGVLELERNGNIVIITMKRPEVLNAINNQLTGEIHAALDEVAQDLDVRAVILTGAGRGFCSGADVNQLMRRTEGGATAREGGADVLAATAGGARSIPVHLRRIPQPVIAAVNGVAAGMGLGIALACDIRIASAEARFASIFIKRSIMPDNGVSLTINRLAGPGIAAEMTLTGNIYDAKWALAKGLVNNVVPHETLMEEARALAESIASNPPIAVRLTKQILYRNELAGLEQGIVNESYGNDILFRTDDNKEAIRSFLEKRAPVFKGQ